MPIFSASNDNLTSLMFTVVTKPQLWWTNIDGPVMFVISNSLTVIHIKYWKNIFNKGIWSLIKAEWHLKIWERERGGPGGDRFWVTLKLSMEKVDGKWKVNKSWFRHLKTRYVIIICELRIFNQKWIVQISNLWNYRNVFDQELRRSKAVLCSEILRNALK